MDASARADVRQQAEETVAAFGVPGLAVVAARGGRPIVDVFLGADAQGNAVTPSSLFPVASITKLATSLAVLRLIDAGALALDDPLAHHLPGAAAAQPDVTIRAVLCHTSGLPLDVPNEASLYRQGTNWPNLAQVCFQTPLRERPWTHVQYSNVGYGLLAMIVERLTGQTFSVALTSLVIDPLGIEAYLGIEPPRPPVVLADVRGSHVGTPLEPFNSPFWRSLALPWAGLITTPFGALELVRAFQGVPLGFLLLGTLTEATRNQTDDLSGGYAPPLIWPRCPWGLGPEIRDEKKPHWAPPQAAPNSFGHAGASGCIAWADPVADVAWAILGTRTADSGWLLRRGPAIGAAILAVR